MFSLKKVRYQIFTLKFLSLALLIADIGWPTGC